MSLPRRPRDLDAPVPNSPFYSPEVTYFQGPYYPSLVTPTSGLVVDPITGTITVTGGGGGGTVTGITASAPLSVDNTDPAIPHLNIDLATANDAGVVQLATDDETRDGLDPNLAVTPLSLQSKVSDSTSTVCSNTIASSTAVKAAYDLAADAIPNGVFSDAGQLLVGSGAGACSVLSRGAADQVLSVNSAGTDLEWTTLAPDGVLGITGTLPIVVDNADPANPVIKVNEAQPATFGTVRGQTSPSGNISLDGTGSALSSETSGQGNIALGSGALANADGTNYNVALGTFAMNSTTTGSANIGIGRSVLFSNTTGPFNISLGICSLFSNTTGASNVALGSDALRLNSDGNSNIAIGSSALRLNVNGSSNIALGFIALCGSTGSGNIALGAAAGSTLTSGNNNVFIGQSICAPNDTASCQLAVGFIGCCYWLTGDSTKAIKPGAGIRDKSGNTGTLGQVLSSDGNNAIEWTTLAPDGVLGITGTLPIVVDNTDPANPVIDVNEATPTDFGTVRGQTCEANNNISLDAGGTALANASGQNNVGIGKAALAAADTASFNVAVGENALTANVDGNFNTAIGRLALSSNVSSGSNTAVGSASLRSSTTGALNTAVGGCALCSVVDGSNNASLGWNSLAANVSGSGSAALGARALEASVGLCNLGLGFSAGSNLTAGDNNVFIGPEVLAPDPVGSGQLVIGFNGSSNWLTGDSTKAIKPGAGILDWCGCLGTPGQVLSSTGELTDTDGNKIEWVDPPAGPEAMPNRFGTVLGQTDPDLRNVSLDGTETALLNNVTGSNNVAIGEAALFQNNSGQRNVALGYWSLIANVSGDRNVSIGNFPLCGNTTGYDNVALGNTALCSNTDGYNNIGIGTGAGCSLTTGNANIAVGHLALNKADTSTNNTAVGASSLLNATGSLNVALGTGAGRNITTGTTNVAIGVDVEVADPQGSRQLVIGFSGSDYWLRGDASCAIQPGAGIVDRLGGCGIEGQIMGSKGNAIEWIATCCLAACPDTFGTVLGQTNTACFNVSLDGGGLALKNNVSGTNNVAIGCAALEYNTGGSNNIAIGCAALLFNTTGTSNIAIGARAGCDMEDGFSNVLIGDIAGYRITSGFQNFLMGFGAGQNITTACNNLAIGALALNQNVTGNKNIAIGLCAGQATTGSENIIIGNEINVASTTGSCQLAIGLSPSFCWLTGDETKAIKPGAGIIDTGNGTGTSGQVLTSTGANAIQWATPDAGFKSVSRTMTLTSAVVTNVFTVNFNTPFLAWTYLSAYREATGELGLKQYMIGASQAQNLVDTATVHEVPATSGWTLVDNTTTDIMTFRFAAPSSGTWRLEVRYMPVLTSFITNPPVPQLA